MSEKSYPWEAAKNIFLPLALKIPKILNLFTTRLSDAESHALATSHHPFICHLLGICFVSPLNLGTSFCWLSKKSSESTAAPPANPCKSLKTSAFSLLMYIYNKNMVLVENILRKYRYSNICDRKRDYFFIFS